MGVEKDAEALGIGGGQDLVEDDGADELNEEANGEVNSSSDDVEELGGVKNAVYPNPDKEKGSMHDIYHRMGVFVPPAVKGEVDDLFVDLRYEYTKQHDEEIEKNWDFFTAIFRVAAKNPELIREEIGIEKPDR
jgi:hypothetical protein